MATVLRARSVPAGSLPGWAGASALLGNTSKTGAPQPAGSPGVSPGLSAQPGEEQGVRSGAPKADPRSWLRCTAGSVVFAVAWRGGRRDARRACGAGIGARRWEGWGGVCRGCTSPEQEEQDFAQGQHPPSRSRGRTGQGEGGRMRQSGGATPSEAGRDPAAA